MGFPQRLLLVVSALVASACGGGGGGAPPPSTVFRVETVTPPDLAEDVPLTGEIDLFFSRPVDPKSLDFDSVRVFAESGDEIFGDRQVASRNRGIVRFIPVQPYFPFAVHTIRVTTEVRDVDGNPLDREYSFRFQTQQAEPVLLTPAQVKDHGNLLVIGRWFHRMTLLPNGRFLVAGGYGSNNSVLRSAEHLHPQLLLGQVVPTPMFQPRAAHVQVHLGGGRVLLAGGEQGDDPFVATASCEIFDLDAFTFLPAAPMHVARSFAAGVRLPDGRVLVTGGQQPDGAGGVRFLDDAEIYDPATDTWTLLPSAMSRERAGHFVAPAPGGDAAILGGTPGEATAELFRFATLDFTPSIQQPQAAHWLAAATLLPDGRAFLAGGVGTRAVNLWSASLGFVQALNTLSEDRLFATATAFEDGRAVVAGGTDFNASPPLVRTTIEVFHPIGGTGKIFRLSDTRLPRPTSHHAAERGADGSIWITGGIPLDLFTLPGLRQAVQLLPEPP